MSESDELERVRDAIYSMSHLLISQAEYIDRSNGKVPRHKYAEYLLLSMYDELKKKYPESDINNWKRSEQDLQ